MKLDELRQLQQDVEIVQEMDKFKQFRYQGTDNVKPGHKMFSCDLRTGEIKEEHYDVQVAFGLKTKSPQKKGRLITDDFHLYKSCLNRRNAERHFNETLGEIRAIARFMRENPMLDVRKTPQWQILSDLGFEAFKGEGSVTAGLIETLKLIKTSENGKSKKVVNEKISICQYYPRTKTAGEVNGLMYGFDMTNASCTFSPVEISDLEFASVVKKSFTNFNLALQLMKKSKQVQKKYAEDFERKWAWMLNMKDEDLTNGFHNYIKENAYVNKAEGE